MLRLELAALMVRNQFQRLYQPHGILIIRYRGQAVADDVVKSAMNFIFIFILSFAVLSICLSAVGLDFITAVSGAATALATLRPGLAPAIGTAGHSPTPPVAAQLPSSAAHPWCRVAFPPLQGTP